LLLRFFSTPFADAISLLLRDDYLMIRYICAMLTIFLARFAILLSCCRYYAAIIDLRHAFAAI